MNDHSDIADSYHYQVIARALAEIDAAQAAGELLTLEAISARLSMSPAHFQRLFSAWVGVSPKRYQQYLTLDFVRELLSQRLPLDEVADRAGLSGTGRLHDLVLRWEAMTPGAFARGGEGVAIRWGRFDSPFGPVIAMGTDQGLCGMGFTAEMGEQETFDDLARRWPEARFTEDPEPLRAWVDAAFSRHGEAKLTLIGAPFQIKVWEALLSIPSGQVTTYSDIAEAIGHPKAVRAVGTAVGRNSISFLIPCHRALRKSGGLGGYHWGLGVKRAILGWEGARAEAD
ncbi:bifunctional helix-turn-helix domain-containing protein/methylated-DNA--[protein]-cysteine S-methyltransferase [Thioclava nitratireducens]|uniref:bifunctional helix-turn-helix domain-containing protein/methylated-DNA--[protein]-cysteine S-methyltransferase n=1 Tax=Thioclava nitratireducens TaxID=1915078 RepID=UPI00247FA1F8|nr:methylated-DNA--[protein]-cysteine S-methyltransferase [Thioclava nitratireducens]WGT48951.1 methylated-DNA--[protein]-cysteine S-methyltransferase [Thioclava nitratireducens]